MNQKVLDSMTRLEKALNQRISAVKNCLNFLRHELLRCVISIENAGNQRLFSTLILTFHLLLELLQQKCFFESVFLLVQVLTHDDESSSYGEPR